MRRSAVDPFELMRGGMGGDTQSGWWGVLQSLTPSGWGLLALFLFVLLTRGPEDTDREVALQRRWPMLGLALPLLSIYALIASAIQHALFTIPDRRDGEPPPWPGPYMPGVVRRTVAVPLAFLGDALFRSEVANANIMGISAPLDAATLAPTLLLALLSALPYMLFVAGPRIAAGAALAWRPWAFRFALFYLSSWFGRHVSL